MLKRFFSLAFLGSLLVFTSCIREEAANAECDITGVDSIWLKSLPEGFLIGNPIVTNDRVSFTIKKGADRSALAPQFYLTPGAHITAKTGNGEVEGNGLLRDFSTPQTYTVYSEDGHWQKDYIVVFNYPQPISLCSFEYFNLENTNRYYQWFEVDNTDLNNSRRDYWGTGNAGFALSGMGKVPSDYPTAPETMGVNGNCVKLVTRDTGSFGNGVNMPIAAGNLFIGEFKAAQAMLFPRKATRFGLQLVGSRPEKLTGYYKYTAADVFTDKHDNICPDRKDTCDIYAVLFEVDPAKFVPLNGDDVLSSERIVMMARIDNPGEPQEWTYFEEPFKEKNGKTFNEQRLRDNGYAITIVATSSRQGAYFEGAIGSTLYIDEIKIKWEGEE
ncbi:MAG: PCMD domain-containing protein [Bacteroidaceae bacterium]|nr:PCMD domain-containing protein [Bacteroidaceae bacterium]